MEDRCRSNTRVDYNTLTEYNTFLVTTVLPREVYTMLNTGGDTTAINQLNRDHRIPLHQLGPQGEVHGALPISVWAVGLPRDDLATAAFIPVNTCSHSHNPRSHSFIPFQPPSTGQDWDLPGQLQTNPACIFFSYNPTDHTITYDGDHGLLVVHLPAKGFGLDMDVLPVSLTNVVLVSVGEGRIAGPVMPVSYTIAALASMGEEEIDEYDGRRLDSTPRYCLMSSCTCGHASIAAS